MKIRLMAVASTALLAAALAGCGSGSGSSSNGSGDDVYRVIVMGGVSAEGVLADQSQTSIAAAKASVDYANANGGVDGEKVTVTVIDDKSDPTTAVTKLRAAIAKQKPDLVLNSGPSTVAEATLPILNQNHILSMNIGPTETSSDASKYPLNFDIAAGASEQLDAYASYFKEKGYKSVAILHGNSAYGETFGSSAEKTLTAAGVKVTGNKEYDTTALDMTSQLEALESTDPDALVIDAYGAPLGYVLKGVAKLGWDIPMIGNTSVSATNLTGAKPPTGLVGTSEVKNLVMQVPKSAKHDSSATAVNAAVKGMLKYGEIKSSFVLAANYDALPLVMAAADAAGSTDADKVAEKLVDSSVLKSAKTVIFPDYGFTSSVHAPQGVSGNYIFISPSVLKNGQFQ
ncbi:MAG: ABC transporter substrate-binding protein [Nocardioides sp.]|uniref:ABC transporter substrate-binding protein n=1 Tax=Nocardioides sp. TaxID=35761 RepID=UPI0039E68255